MEETEKINQVKKALKNIVTGDSTSLTSALKTLEESLTIQEEEILYQKTIDDFAESHSTNKQKIIQEIQSHLTERKQKGVS